MREDKNFEDYDTSDWEHLLGGPEDEALEPVETTRAESWESSDWMASSEEPIDVLADYHVGEVLDTDELPARSTLEISKAENSWIKRSYVLWMSVDEIALRTQRSLLEIDDLLNLAGLRFTWKFASTQSHLCPYTGDADELLAMAGGLVFDFDMLVTAGVLHESRPVRQDGALLPDDLSPVEKRRWIKFVARFAGSARALTLCSSLRDGHMAYLLHLQRRDPLPALGALNSDAMRLHGDFQVARTALLSYGRAIVVRSATQLFGLWAQKCTSNAPYVQRTSFDTNEWDRINEWKLVIRPHDVVTPLAIEVVGAIVHGDVRALGQLECAGNSAATAFCARRKPPAERSEYTFGRSCGWSFEAENWLPDVDSFQRLLHATYPFNAQAAKVLGIRIAGRRAKPPAHGDEQ